jgi:putative tryptophan/tyrosine transport system substrate-binding protein
MRRREFIGLIGSAAAWPLLARAQSARIRRIGVLLLFAQDDPEATVRVQALKGGLQALGWVDGENLQIEYRFADGDIDRLRELAQELVNLPVEVIVSNVGRRPIPTRSTPIVFAMAHSLGVLEPGLVENLSHPAENFTGFTNGLEPAIVGKWLEFLKAMAPDVTRVGFIFNPHATPVSMAWLHELESMASSFATEPVALRVQHASDIKASLAELGRAPGSAHIVMPDVFVLAHHADIVRYAAQCNVPGCYPFRYFALGGGLMSYGSNGAQVSRQAASYVDRILRGARPGDLPIQQPNDLELLINLKTAKAMNLAPPPRLLARADEVIE